MKISGNKIYISDTKYLEDKETFFYFYSRVSDARKEKIDRLRYEKEKRLSLAAAVLLDSVLKRNGITEYKLGFGEKGKPFLKGYPDVKFNLSHSEERVMCILSDSEAGCDVEKMGKANLKMAERFFAANEYAMIRAAKTVQEKEEMFYRLWTLKESFLKATGMGMQVPLNAFCFSFTEDGISVSQNLNGEQYYLKEYDFQDGYRYAACSLQPEFHEPEWILQEIENNCSFFVDEVN